MHSMGFFLGNGCLNPDEVHVSITGTLLCELKLDVYFWIVDTLCYQEHWRHIIVFTIIRCKFLRTGKLQNECATKTWMHNHSVPPKKVFHNEYCSFAVSWCLFNHHKLLITNRLKPLKYVLPIILLKLVWAFKTTTKTPKYLEQSKSWNIPNHNENLISNNYYYAA